MSNVDATPRSACECAVATLFSAAEFGNKCVRGSPTLAERSSLMGRPEPAKKVSRSSLSVVQSMPGTFFRREGREELASAGRFSMSSRKNCHILQFYVPSGESSETPCPNCKHIDV